METPGLSVASPKPVSLPLSQAELKAWMITYISQLLSLDKEGIDTSALFDSFGMDSIEAVVMAGIMEEEFGVLIEPTLLLEYPSIDLFSTANCRKD
ncbi:acyl carrier protein [Aestuariivirga sp.]|uniref:acyl carrier protein n=1 Tax=Aestuariivirga sp. TaxID=2650926 RepID=UPI003593D150